MLYIYIYIYICLSIIKIPYHISKHHYMKQLLLVKIMRLAVHWCIVKPPVLYGEMQLPPANRTQQGKKPTVRGACWFRLTP